MFLIAVVGLARPSLVRLPDRMAAVWVWAVSVGLFVGGGVLMSPENGESTASDVPPTVTRQSMSDPETPEEREERIRRAGSRPLEDFQASFIERPAPSDGGAAVADESQETDGVDASNGGCLCRDMVRWAVAVDHRRRGALVRSG